MSAHFDRAPRDRKSHHPATSTSRGGVWRSGVVAIASMASAVTAGLLLAVAPAQAADAAQAAGAAQSAQAGQSARAAQSAQAGQAGVERHSPFAPVRSYAGPNGEVELSAACTAPTHPGQAACFAISRQQIQTKLGGHRTGDAVHAAAAMRPAGYGPSALRHAYNLPSSRGAGRVVAIVDAYNDPKAESDLAHYRRAYHLPPCTRANGCFRKVNQNGGSSYPHSNAGWAAEISLDLDMVSAVCPKCHILLVEGSSSYINDLGKAVNTAVRLGAKYISNSYGTSESSSDASYDSQYFNHPGVVITASAGDGGYATAYPADSRYVTAVGGTSLRRASSPRGWSEKAWNGTGSGCSSDAAKPSWQKASACSKRIGNDVAAVADPNTGVAVYDTYKAGGWAIYGGTSAASPIIAATYALAGTPRAGTYPASYPYTHRSALHDVTSGHNGSCHRSYLCTARRGYDGPTGLGTPKGLAAFRAR